MARRERTTGLPRHRAQERAPRGARTFAGITFDERRVRFAVLGVAAALLLVVAGVFAWQIYYEQFQRPNTVVLRVEDQEVKLSYYADRLLPFLQEAQQTGAETSTALLEEQLLAKLEEEALTILVGRDNAISLSHDDVTQAIANEFNVPVGGSGSAFDSIYRDRLRDLGMSDANYRRLAEASEVNDRLLAKYRADLGDTGEQVTLRTVLVGSREDAQAVYDRVTNGEDMGLIAQTESLHLESRQLDGVLPAEAPQLLPDAVQAAIEGKEDGTLLEPVQVQQSWWVVRLEKRETLSYSETQKAEIAEQMLLDAIAAKRSEVSIERSLDSADIKWAEKNIS